MEIWGRQGRAQALRRPSRPQHACRAGPARQSDRQAASPLRHRRRSSGATGELETGTPSSNPWAAAAKLELEGLCIKQRGLHAGGPDRSYGCAPRPPARVGVLPRPHKGAGAGAGGWAPQVPPSRAPPPARTSHVPQSTSADPPSCIQAGTPRLGCVGGGGVPVGG